MGLIAKIERFFRKVDKTDSALPVVPKEEAGARSVSTARVKRGMFSNQIWYVDPERQSIYEDIENMDGNDGITSQALDTIAEVAIGLEEGYTDKFEIDCDDKKTLTIINKCVNRLHLRRDADDIIRKMVKHGNEFRELIIGRDFDGQLKVLRLKGDLPGYTFYPNINRGNDDINPEFPWIQKLSPWFASKTIPFRPWQIVHWAYGERKMGIGTPMLASARRNWKLLQFLEDTMALARGTRAYMKLVHKVPVSPKATQDDMEKAIENYKANVEKKEFFNWAQGHTQEVPDPITVDADMYIPEDGSKRGGVEVVDPQNQNLQQIDDVIYAQSKHISRLGVPRSYLNIEGSNSGALNQGDSSKGGDKHFARKIRGVQSAFIEGLVFVINIELMLHGVKPHNEDGTLVYSIKMAKVNTEDAYNKARAEFTTAQAAETWLKMFDVPEGLLVDRFLKLNGEERAKYEEKLKLRTKPNPAFMTGGSALNPANGKPGVGNEGGAPNGKRPGSEEKSDD